MLHDIGEKITIEQPLPNKQIYFFISVAFASCFWGMGGRIGNALKFILPEGGGIGGKKPCPAGGGIIPPCGGIYIGLKFGGIIGNPGGAMPGMKCGGTIPG